MPVEITQVSLMPADFFTANPSIDVPSMKNHSSQLADHCHTNGNAVTNGHINGETNGVNGVNGA